MGISILAWLSSLELYGGIGMITRPIWKCPCINLYVIYPLHVCGLGGLWYLKPLSTIFQLYMWTYHFTSRTLTYNHLHVYVELSHYQYILFVVSQLSTQYSGTRAKTGWLGIKWCMLTPYSLSYLTCNCFVDLSCLEHHGETRPDFVCISKFDLGISSRKKKCLNCKYQPTKLQK